MDGRRTDGSRPGSMDGWRTDGIRPGILDGSRTDGSRPCNMDGWRTDGSRPGSMDRRTDGSRPGSMDGSRPGSIDGRTTDGSRPGSMVHRRTEVSKHSEFSAGKHNSQPRPIICRTLEAQQPEMNINHDDPHPRHIRGARPEEMQFKTVLGHRRKGRKTLPAKLQPSVFNVPVRNMYTCLTVSDNKETRNMTESAENMSQCSAGSSKSSEGKKYQMKKCKRLHEVTDTLRLRSCEKASSRFDMLHVRVGERIVQIAHTCPIPVSTVMQDISETLGLDVGIGRLCVNGSSVTYTHLVYPSDSLEFNIRGLGGSRSKKRDVLHEGMCVCCDCKRKNESYYYHIKYLREQNKDVASFLQTKFKLNNNACVCRSCKFRAERDKLDHDHHLISLLRNPGSTQSASCQSLVNVMHLARR